MKVKYITFVLVVSVLFCSYAFAKDPLATGRHDASVVRSQIKTAMSMGISGKKNIAKSVLKYNINNNRYEVKRDLTYTKNNPLKVYNNAKSDIKNFGTSREKAIAAGLDQNFLPKLKSRF